MTTKPIVQETYIGDGVYAEFDGYSIELYTSNGVDRSEGIYLEPVVFKALVVWARSLGYQL